MKLARFAFTFLLILFVSARALAQPQPPNPSTGIATIGIGAAFDRQGFEGWEDVLKRALDRYGHAFFLPGIYQFDQVANITQSAVLIEGSPGAQLRPAASGAVGIFNITGENVTIRGLQFRATSFVADQRLIRYTSSDDPRIYDCVFMMDTSPAGNPLAPPTLIGSTTTPMVALEAITCSRPKVLYNTFLPNHAWVCVRIDNGHGHQVDFNNFSSNAESGLGGIAELTSTGSNVRPMYIGVDVQGGEWGEVNHNRFFGLGDGSGLVFAGGVKEVFACILVNSTAAPTDQEQMHSQVAGNRFEAVFSPGYTRLYGVNSYSYQNNLAGLANVGGGSAPNAAGEAALIISCRRTADGTNNKGYANDFGTLVAADVSFSVFVEGNDFHNNGSGDGASIYVEYCDEPYIGSCRFGVGSSLFYIWINSATVKRGVIQNCKFFRESSGNYAINLDASGAITDGFYIGGNVTQDLVHLVRDLSDVHTLASKKVFTGIDDGSLNQGAQTFLTSTLTFNTAAETLDNGTTSSNPNDGLASFFVGDLLSIAGATDQANNNVTSVLTAGGNAITVPFNVTTQATPSAGTTLRRVPPSFQQTLLTTVSITTASETLTDSASGLGGWAVGDVIGIQGAAQQGNNVVTTVLTAAAGSITVAANLVDDAAIAALVLRKYPTDHQYTAASFAFNTTAETITDSANGLGFLRPGDIISIVGAGDQANNVVTTVLTAAAGSITVTHNLTTDAADADVTTIRRLRRMPNTNIKLDG